MPPTTLFEKDFLKDKSSNSNSEAIRVWSFDDNPAPEDRDGDGFNDIDENGEEILYPQLPVEKPALEMQTRQAKMIFELAEEGVNLETSKHHQIKQGNTLSQLDGFDCHVSRSRQSQ